MDLFLHGKNVVAIWLVTLTIVVLFIHMLVMGWKATSLTETPHERRVRFTNFMLLDAVGLAIMAMLFVTLTIASGGL